MLPSAAMLAPWSSPNAGLHNDGESWESFEARRETHKARGINGNGAGTPLQVMAQTVRWPTATAQDAASSGRVGRAPNSHPGTTLTDAAETVPWPTPVTADDCSRGSLTADRDHMGMRSVDAIARGLTPDPSSAATASGGSFRLNWRFSEWLMGLPRNWLAGSLWALPSRAVVARLRALGNAVVPLQAYVPARALYELMTGGLDGKAAA